MKADEKLAYMANQIAKFFVSQGEERAPAGIADHIRKFWNPDMRQDFLAAAAAGTLDLHPAVKAALPLLNAQQDAQT
ncbi:MAG TPA: formate dehydrogenase subunit delta [Rhizomicrobium sp.]|jgi:formate dehydrogenase subunit delta|nr:formate dehydrogenase subunit delta [Rhizomicrobium sp.]